MKNERRARAICITIWLVFLLLQSINGVSVALNYPAYELCQELHGPLSSAAMHKYHILSIPMVSMVGMIHGTLGMSLRTSLATGMPFAIKGVVTHVLHLYPFESRVPDAKRRQLEVEVILVSAILLFCAFFIGLFVALAFDASRRRLLQEQKLVQSLQAKRVEQLEGEKQRIEYDLKFTQQRLTQTHYLMLSS